MKQIRIVGLVMLLLFPAVARPTAALATQATGFTVHATKAANPNLGSPEEAAAFFTKDYAKAFDAAYPRVSKSELESLLDGVLKKSPEALNPLKLRRSEDIAKLFDLPARAPKKGESLVVSEMAVYGIDPETSQIVFARNRKGTTPLHFATAKGLQEDVGREHLKLLETIGIDSSQIQFRQTLFVSMRSEEVGKPVSDASSPEVDSIFTYVTRALDGIEVDGSHAKITSRSKGKVVGLDVRWPEIKLHPSLSSGKCKDAAALKSEILPRVKDLSEGNEANLLMAFVLRPVSLKGKRVFVPAVKVGILPYDDEHEIEEGAIFYVDLPQQTLTCDSDNAPEE